MQLRVHVLAFTRIFGYVGLKGSLSRSLQTILCINLDGTEKNPDEIGVFRRESFCS